MTYCPECNSEIAEIDTFCAYCGFAVNINPAQSNEQEETAVDESKNGSSEAEVLEGATDLNETPVETPWMSTSESVAVAQSKTVETESNLAVAHDTPAKESVFEAAAAEEMAFADADTEVVEAKDMPVQETARIEEKPAIQGEELADTFYDAETDISKQESKPIVEQFVLDPAPLVDQPRQESTMSSVAAQTTPTEDIDFGETVPYVPADFEKHNLKTDEPAASEEIAHSFDSAISESEAEASVSAIASETTPQRDNELPLVAEIAETSLPAAAVTAASAAMEMQPAEKKKEEPSPVETKDSAVPAPSSDLDAEGRSFTDPNLNISDTDGKKAKLKPLADGTVLNNRYEIVRKIGGGGMGAVYLANDRNLGGVLRAVKEMVQSYIEEDQQEKAVNDFKRESMLLTSLDHTAIPTIFDYFYDEKEARFYLVMKYISGGDLASRLRSTPEGKINELTVTEWAMQIADVLDYLHNHQPPIVYRDLKPSNIMVDGNSGRVMLIDFGIARWVNKEEKGVTAVGTMGYAPPELFSGNVEPRSDIYSLGSTMFHLLTGADPQSNPLLIFDFNKNPRPRQINSQLTDQIEQILMRTVEYNADKRFESAAELKRVLAQHLENLKQGSVSFGVIDTAIGVQPLSSVPVFCGFCGQKIVASDLFCPFCGAQQPIAQQQAATLQPQAVYAPVQTQPTARLMVIGTSDLERSEFTLDKESNLVGRRDPMSNIFPEIDLSKFDPQTKVSRRHARIWKDSGRYMVEDLGSSNGTVLMNPNAVPTRLLPHQPKVLASGDKIKVGDTTLHFVTS